MPVQLIAQLIVTFGPSAAQLIDALIAKWETNGNVTAAEWQELKVMLAQSPADKMKTALAAAGISLDDPHAIALLALVK